MKLKSVIGILLVVLSVAGIVCWESFGRAAVLSSEVLTASHDIAAGSTVAAEDLSISSVNKEDIMPAALGPESVNDILGKRVLSDLSEGQQLSVLWFSDQPELIKEGESIFVIPSSWLYPKSCLLKSADECNVYLMPEKRLLGCFVLAVVGDDVEIVCSADEYFKIYDLMQREELSSLLIVADEPEWRSAE